MTGGTDRVTRGTGGRGGKVAFYTHRRHNVLVGGGVGLGISLGAGLYPSVIFSYTASVVELRKTITAGQMNENLGYRSRSCHEKLHIWDATQIT